MIECRVQMRRQQQAIENIESLGVGRTCGPRLDVAGAQEFHDAEVSYSAATIPIECYDHLGRVAATALSDWIRRPMSDSELLFAAHERFAMTCW